MVRTTDENGPIEAATKRVIDLVGGLSSRISAGQRVLIKPNFVAPVPTAVTSPDVLRAIVKEIVSIGATPVIGECPGFEFDSEVTFKFLKVRELADEIGAEFVNLERDEYVESGFHHPWVKCVRVARLAVECDAIINIPRMKSHKLTDISLSIKNCFGLIAKRYRWNRRSKPDQSSH